MAVRVSRECLGGEFVHVTGLGWMRYNGHVWREVPREAVVEAVRAWTSDRLLEAAQAHAAGTGGPGAVKAWVRWQSVARVKAAVEFARGLLALDASELDAHPDLLNCPNGVVDLRTGELKPSLSIYYFTKVTAVDYVPGATHPDWTAALTAFPAPILTWCQTRYGQGITGHMTPDAGVILHHGPGRNGKSTVLAGISAALGDFYFLASDQILLDNTAGATTDMYDLRGTRFVAVEELPEGARLNTVKLKKIAGTDRITARKLYHDNVSFRATHSLFVNTNYIPTVQDTDDATWRRLLLVVFPYKYVKSPSKPHHLKADPELQSRIQDEGPAQAALAWMVEGAVRWYAERRNPAAVPQIVAEDTAEWRDEVDHVAIFWANHLSPSPAHYVYAGDLVWQFNNYLRTHGNSPWSQALLIRRFRDHPITREAGVEQTRIRQEAPDLDLTESRPSAATDPFTRLPGIPGGRIHAWKGLRFRYTRELASPAGPTWEEAAGPAGPPSIESFHE
jgi:putative DNA primase/helicase